MKRSTFNYLVDVLRDYYCIDKYIKQREEELRFPFHETDMNQGIKGTREKYDTQDKLMITIEQDRRLTSLKRNKTLIDEAVAEADADTQTIIRELYMKRYPTYTMKGLVINKKIFVSKSQAYARRNQFFDDLAQKFGLNI